MPMFYFNKTFKIELLQQTKGTPYGMKMKHKNTKSPRAFIYLIIFYYVINYHMNKKV